MNKASFDFWSSVQGLASEDIKNIKMYLKLLEREEKQLEDNAAAGDNYAKDRIYSIKEKRN